MEAYKDTLSRCKQTNQDIYIYYVRIRCAFVVEDHLA